MEEGQGGAASSTDLSTMENERSEQNGEFWRPEDERYYNPEQKTAATPSGRWRYPANFEDVEPIEPPKRSKKKKKRKNSEVASTVTTDSGEAFPEDPDGGLYGERQKPTASTSVERRTTDNVIFDHEL